MLRRYEMDLFQAMDMLDVPEEVLGKMPEEGKLKSRPADAKIILCATRSRNPLIVRVLPAAGGWCG